MRRSRRIALAAAGTLLASAMSLGGAAPAYAHNYLVSSTPAEGEMLTELPEEFVITTNDALLDLGGESSGFALQVVGPDGLYYGDGCLTVSGASMTTDAALGEAGEYEVLWQVVSGDGHTVSGEYGFTWAPGDEFTPAAGSAAPPVCGQTTQTPAPSAPPAAEPTDPVTEEPAATSTGETVNPALLAIGIAAMLAALAVALLLARRRKSNS